MQIYLNLLVKRPTLNEYLNGNGNMPALSMCCSVKRFSSRNKISSIISSRKYLDLINLDNKMQ